MPLHKEASSFFLLFPLRLCGKAFPSGSRAQPACVTLTLPELRFARRLILDVQVGRLQPSTR